MNASDAAALNVEEGDEITLSLNGETYQLQVRLATAMPGGTVGLSIGLPGSPTVDLPAWGTMSGAQQ